MTKRKSARKQNKRKSTKKRASIKRRNTTKKQNKKKTKKKSIKKRKTSVKKRKSTKKKPKSTKKKTNGKTKKKSIKKKKMTKKKSIKKSTKKKRDGSKKKSSKKKKKDDDDDDDDDTNYCSFQKMTDKMVSEKVEKLKETNLETRKDIMKSELKLAKSAEPNKKKETVQKFNNAYKHSKCKKWVILTVYVNIYEYHSASTEYTDPILDIYIDNGIKVDILNDVAEYAKKKDEFILYGLIKERLKKQKGGIDTSVFESKQEEKPFVDTQNTETTGGSDSLAIEKKEEKPFVETQNTETTGGSDSLAIEKEIDNILGGTQNKGLHIKENTNLVEAGIIDNTGKERDNIVIGGVPKSGELQEAGLDEYLEELENHKINTALNEHYGGSYGSIPPPPSPSTDKTSSFESISDLTRQNASGGGFSATPSLSISTDSSTKSNYDDIVNSSILGGYGETSNPVVETKPDLHPASNTPSYDSYNMEGGASKDDEEPTDEEYYTDKVKIIQEEFNNKSFETMDRKEDELSLEEMDEFLRELIKYGIDKNVLREYWRKIKSRKVQNLIINNSKIYPR